MSSLIILGRQPALGIAELESLLGGDCLKLLNPTAYQVNLEHSQVPFYRLGGSIKLGKVIATIETQNWRKIEGYFIKNISGLAEMMPEGKLTIGLSVYGIKASTEEITRTALKIKKLIRSSGRPVRIVPNKDSVISTAQVIHNDLTGNNGWEILIVADAKAENVFLALTTCIQDIEAYTARDQARPMRDTRVGMLPPKLGQIIVNLATGSMGNLAEKSKHNITILDPFCGTGVVLQEALLMGYSAYGSDLEPRMISYTTTNIKWLGERFSAHSLKSSNVGVNYSNNYSRDELEDFTLKTTTELGDATSHRWTKQFDFIAAETYLGRPFSVEPSSDMLIRVIHDVNNIHRKFLKNLKNQTNSGFKLCIGVPAWFTKNGLIHLPLLDDLEKIGYTRMNFKFATFDQLIYHRDGQFVGRELVVLIRN